MSGSTQPESNKLTTGNFWTALQNGFSNVITLAAGAASTVHALEASDPIVVAGINLVDEFFPGFAAIEGIANAVLAGAQATAAAMTATAAPYAGGSPSTGKAA